MVNNDPSKVDAYTRITKSGKSVQVKAYDRTNADAATEARATPGRPPIAAQTGNFANGRSLPGVWLEPQKPPLGPHDPATADALVNRVLGKTDHLDDHQFGNEVVDRILSQKTADVIKAAQRIKDDPNLVNLAGVRPVRVESYKRRNNVTGKVSRVHQYIQRRDAALPDGPHINAKAGAYGAAESALPKTNPLVVSRRSQPTLDDLPFDQSYTHRPVLHLPDDPKHPDQEYIAFRVGDGWQESAFVVARKKGSESIYGSTSSLEWDTESGEIMGLNTNAADRRQGYAKDLLRRAREIDPRVKHSDILTEDGGAFSKANPQQVKAATAPYTPPEHTDAGLRGPEQFPGVPERRRGAYRGDPGFPYMKPGNGLRVGAQADLVKTAVLNTTRHVPVRLAQHFPAVYVGRPESEVMDPDPASTAFVAHWADGRPDQMHVKRLAFRPEFAASVSAARASGFMSRGADDPLQQVIDHESTHAWRNLLETYGSAENTEQFYVDLTQALRDVYGEDPPSDDPLSRLPPRAFAQAFAAHRDDITIDLSVYASSDEDEFIAEAYAEYVGNPNPGPLAARIGHAVQQMAIRLADEVPDADPAHADGTGDTDYAIAAQKIARSPLSGRITKTGSDGKPLNDAFRSLSALRPGDHVEFRRSEGTWLGGDVWSLDDRPDGSIDVHMVVREDSLSLLDDTEDATDVVVKIRPDGTGTDAVHLVRAKGDPALPPAITQPTIPVIGARQVFNRNGDLIIDGLERPGFLKNGDKIYVSRPIPQERQKDRTLSLGDEYLITGARGGRKAYIRRTSQNGPWEVLTEAGKVNEQINDRYASVTVRLNDTRFDYGWLTDGKGGSTPAKKVIDNLFDQAWVFNQEDGNRTEADLQDALTDKPAGFSFRLPDRRIVTKTDNADWAVGGRSPFSEFMLSRTIANREILTEPAGEWIDARQVTKPTPFSARTYEHPGWRVPNIVATENSRFGVRSAKDDERARLADALTETSRFLPPAGAARLSSIQAEIGYPLADEPGDNLALAYVTGDGKRLHMNFSGMDYDATERAAAMASQFHPPNHPTPVQSVVDHETGHVLHRFIETAPEPIQAQFRSDILDALNEAGIYHFPEIAPGVVPGSQDEWETALRKSNPSQMMNALSLYAHKNIYEFLAEAWSEYIGAAAGASDYADTQDMIKNVQDRLAELREHRADPGEEESYDLIDEEIQDTNRTLLDLLHAADDHVPVRPLATAVGNAVQRALEAMSLHPETSAS